MTNGLFRRNFRDWYGQLPYRVSVMAKNDIILNFTKRHGSYSEDGTSFKKWAPRKSDKNNKDRTRGILIKSGRLYRSFRPVPSPGVARVVTDVPYAQKHNEGFKGVEYVKPHKRNSPSRRSVKNGKKARTVSRHNVKGHSRKVDNTARPFLVTSPHFSREMQELILNELEQLFLKSF
ncbi:MAG: phage virion morphogenesis protein [Bacteroidetes bacterium]|nr:phage virion morphogenesis protein [Bacteroidota bacterium]